MRKTVWLFLLLGACKVQKPPVSKHATAGRTPVSGKLWASLFQQKAPEYDALCFQAYNLARLKLDIALASSHQKPLAIVTDIDETILDNSPYAVKRSLGGEDYEIKSWKEWTARAEADTLAGALGFFKYAASKGVEVYYVTNRDEDEREGTRKNLEKFGFPLPDNRHLVLRQGVSSKEPRRLEILKTHDIVLLIGDNLADFHMLYDKKSEGERFSVTQRLSGDFGSRFIILPNTTYGDWETALYRYNYMLTESQKDSIVRAALKSY